MNNLDIEKIFDRSFHHVFSKRKFFFLFPVLVLCGFFMIICRAISSGAGYWVTISLTFLPIFLSSGFLLAGGIVLIRAYHNELKKHPFSLIKILQESWQMLLNISYVSLPLVLAYFLLWILMGVFYLLKELPAIGDLIGAFLSFAPFLLILATILLGIFNIVVLFFAAPEAALRTGMRLDLVISIFHRLKTCILSNLLHLFLGLLPSFLCLIILYAAASLTGDTFFSRTKLVSKIFQSFFVMIPFCALLTPSVIFFFNFSAESFVFYRKKEKEEDKKMHEAL